MCSNLEEDACTSSSVSMSSTEGSSRPSAQYRSTSAINFVFRWSVSVIQQAPKAFVPGKAAGGLRFSDLFWTAATGAGASRATPWRGRTFPELQSTGLACRPQWHHCAAPRPPARPKPPLHSSHSASDRVAGGEGRVDWSPTAMADDAAADIRPRCFIAFLSPTARQSGTNDGSASYRLAYLRNALAQMCVTPPVRYLPTL